MVQLNDYRSLVDMLDHFPRAEVVSFTASSFVLPPNSDRGVEFPCLRKVAVNFMALGRWSKEASREMVKILETLANHASLTNVHLFASSRHKFYEDETPWLVGRTQAMRREDLLAKFVTKGSDKRASKSEAFVE